MNEAAGGSFRQSVRGMSDPFPSTFSPAPWDPHSVPTILTPAPRTTLGVLLHRLCLLHRKPFPLSNFNSSYSSWIKHHFLQNTFPVPAITTFTLTSHQTQTRQEFLPWLPEVLRTSLLMICLPHYTVASCRQPPCCLEYQALA